MNSPCISWINSIWSWYIILLICCWIWFANIFFKSYILIGPWYIVFFPCRIFFWLLNQDNAGLIEWVKKYSLLFDLGRLWERVVLRLLLNFWWNASVKIYHPGMVFSLIYFIEVWSPGGSNNKESACSVRNLSFIPGSGRSPKEGNGYPTPVFLPGEFHGQKSLSMGS